MFSALDESTYIAEMIPCSRLCRQPFFFNLWNNQSHVTQHPKTFMKKKKHFPSQL